MIRRDMPEVLHVERACFDFPWSEEDFIRRLRQRNCIGMVVETNESVRGHMIYELHGSRLCLLSMAVDPEYQRMGLGTAMVNKLKAKLSTGRRERIECYVRERNLNAQLFFRRLGFEAVQVHRDYCEDLLGVEDAYEMVFSVRNLEHAP